MFCIRDNLGIFPNVIVRTSTISNGKIEHPLILVYAFLYFSSLGYFLICDFYYHFFLYSKPLVISTTFIWNKWWFICSKGIKVSKKLICLRIYCKMDFTDGFRWRKDHSKIVLISKYINLERKQTVKKLTKQNGKLLVELSPGLMAVALLDTNVPSSFHTRNIIIWQFRRQLWCGEVLT